MKLYDDPLYIEMCRKAGEIQAARKYEVGDFFDHNIGTIIFGSGFDNNESCRDTSAIWLPRLDQLIEMLGPSYQVAASYNISEEGVTYGITFNHGAGNAIIQNTSLERCVLAAVMYKHHGKRWDFDKKEWVKV